MSHHSIQIVLFLTLCGFVLFMLFVGFYILKRFGNPFPQLFFEFDKKMWMTLGLGLVFFGFYVVLVTFWAWLFSNNSYKILTLLYQYKTEAIYVALFLFASISFSIYLVRLLIKRLYNSRSK